VQAFNLIVFKIALIIIPKSYLNTVMVQGIKEEEMHLFHIKIQIFSLEGKIS
jgi:hypothetical protein